NFAQGVAALSQQGAGNFTIGEDKTVVQSAMEREDQAAVNLWTGVSIAGGIGDIGLSILGPAGLARGAARGVGSVPRGATAAEQLTQSATGARALTNTEQLFSTMARTPYNA